MTHAEDGGVEPRPQEVEHVLHAGLPVGRQAPQVGAPDHDGAGAKGHRFDGVAASTHAAVEQHLDLVAHGFGDAVKALALGAKAVMIGRASLWGLAANGQAGVENVLDIMRSGIESALLGLGHASIHDLGPDDLVIPEGFSRHLG